MGVGNDAAFIFCVYDWRSGNIVMKGSSGGTAILQLTSTLAGFAACANNTIQIWEHPSLGSDFVSSIDGQAFLATVRPCSLATFACICSVPDPGSRCGTSIVVGHPDGTVMVFQQAKGGGTPDDEGGEWIVSGSKKNPGSRYFRAFDANEKVPSASCSFHPQPRCCQCHKRI